MLKLKLPSSSGNKQLSVWYSFLDSTAIICIPGTWLLHFGSGEFLGQVVFPTEGLEILCNEDHYRFACPYSSGDKITLSGW